MPWPPPLPSREPPEEFPPARGNPGKAPLRRRSFWWRHQWIWWLSAALLLMLVGLSAVLAILARRAEPYLRARVVQGLEDRFHTKVELDSFHLSVRHGQEAEFGIWAMGKGLRIWRPGGGLVQTTEGQLPMISLEEFSFHVPLRRIETGQPVRIPQVKLKGLEVHVPPRWQRNEALERQPGSSADSGNNPLGGVLVEKVLCEQANVVIETDKPGKLPMVFAITQLKLKHVRMGQPMEFDAELTNPKPTGEIQSSGRFGPWETGDPGMSPLKGKYTFRKANLGEFNGIAGTLSSNGTYEGTLREITVDGETMTPDFRLTQFGTALPLHTKFRARVDGTNGDTYLDTVDATLGTSRFTTSGMVVRVKVDAANRPQPNEADAGGAGEEGVRLTAAEERPQVGHVIDMNVDVPRGNMGDFMRLVSKNGIPLVTGVVETKAKLHIDPGPEPVHKRMKLNGNFRLEDARFTNDRFQGKVEELSYRAQGRPDSMKFADPKSVTWQMEGSFRVADGVITLPDLKYDVPGADIGLKGTYSLDGPLNFDGMARMNATVSQMVGGWKGFLLKPADRFFKKDGAGTEVPITVRGTKDAPDFGVDLGKFGAGTHPERPGGK